MRLLNKNKTTVAAIGTFLLLLGTTSGVDGFAPCGGLCRGTCSGLHQPQIPARTSSLYSSNREEEIAKLEEQLRKLKQTPPPEEEPAVDGIDDARKKLTKVKGKDMILSEQDLVEQDLLSSEQEGGGNFITTILGGIAAIVLLVFFSQIPIGQENLSRYSATSSAPSAMKTIDLGDLNTFQQQK